MQRLRQAADVVQRRLRQLVDLAQFGAQAAIPRAHACLPARSIEPMAVRIWPNSSCSSRAMWCRVDSRAAISFCTSSRRCADKDASCANSRRLVRISVQAGDRDRHERRREKPVHLTLNAPVDVLDARRGLLFAFVVLHEKPGDGPAERGLSRLQRAAGSARARRPRGRSRRARTCDRRRPRTEPVELPRILALLGRPARHGDCFLALRSASRRSARIRSNCADQAVSGYGSSGVQHVAHRQAEQRSDRSGCAAAGASPCGCDRPDRAAGRAGR